MTERQQMSQTMKGSVRHKNQNVRVAAYGRYSCDQQSELSAEDQLNRIRHSVKNGLIPGRNPADLSICEEWFIKDEAQSGKTVGRVGYERIMQGIRAKSFDLLIVDDLSRLTRDLGNLLNLYEMLKWYEVELYSICDRVSSCDSNAKMYFTVRGMVNDFSNEVHAERVLRGMEMRVLQGYSTGHCPYGYRSEATKFQNAKGKPYPSHYKILIDEDEAQVVRRIFAMYMTGEIGAVRIAKTLNEEKLAPPCASRRNSSLRTDWSPGSISNILDNEKYIGVWRWKKTRIGIHPETKKRISRARPMNEWISPADGHQLEHLRIVEQDAWDKVQKIRKIKDAEVKVIGPERRWGRRAGRLPEHPFSGILECADCSSNFMLISGKSGGYYGCVSAHRKGTCSNRQLINIERIEAGMYSLLGDNLCRPDVIGFAARKYKEAMRAKLKGAPDRMLAISRDVKKAEQEKENLIQFIAQGKGSESISDAIRDRESRIATLNTELGVLRKDQPKLRELAEDEIGRRIRGLGAAIRQYPLECMPVVRRMFPNKVRVGSRGKAVGSIIESKNLFSMTGAIHLNEGLAVNFERLVPKKNPKNTEGEAAGLPPDQTKMPNPDFCVSESQKFGMLNLGVTNGD